jgi:hypothetical protein
MFAKFSTQCPVCERQILVGEEIAKAGRKWAHATCSPETEVERREVSNPASFKTGPVWTKNAIRRLLEHSDLAVERACVALLDRQTDVEQASDATIRKNWVGFNAADAKRLSKAGKWVRSGNHLDGWFLKEARRRVVKYAGQLADIANEKEAVVPRPEPVQTPRNGTYAEQVAAEVLAGSSVVDAIGRVMP